MKIEFKQQEFEGENHILTTFQGRNGNFCCMLNAKCISSLKTKKAHDKKVSELVSKYNLTEIV